MLKEKLQEIGYITGSHGIKGELKLSLNQFIVDKFPLKDLVLFIEVNKNTFNPLIIENSYQKNSNLILKLKELNHINEIQDYLKKSVYINQNDFDNYFSELVNFKEYEVFEKNISFGKVIDIMDNGIYELFKININNKKTWVPNVDRYIEKIDHENKQIIVKDSEVLI